MCTSNPPPPQGGSVESPVVIPSVAISPVDIECSLCWQILNTLVITVKWINGGSYSRQCVYLSEPLKRCGNWLSYVVFVFPAYISSFSHSCFKIPNRSNLRKKMLFWFTAWGLQFVIVEEGWQLRVGVSLSYWTQSGREMMKILTSPHPFFY